MESVVCASWLGYSAISRTQVKLDYALDQVSMPLFLARLPVHEGPSQGLLADLVGDVCRTGTIKPTTNALSSGDKLIEPQQLIVISRRIRHDGKASKRFELIEHMYL